jgi:hypothetical protein
VTDALIALAVGLIFLLVIIPLLAGFVFTLLDVLWRIDIGLSKVLWLSLVLLIPGVGALIYWLFRPKDFNPWTEKQREGSFIVLPASSAHVAQPAVDERRRPAELRPALRMNPALQGGADPEPSNDAPH